MASMRKIALKSADGETFEVDEAVALESQTIKHLIEDDCAENVIPLPNVTSHILSKVMEYCKKHDENSAADKDKSGKDIIKAFDFDFVKVDQATLFDLILAANYLKQVTETREYRIAEIFFIFRKKKAETTKRKT